MSSCGTVLIAVLSAAIYCEGAKRRASGSLSMRMVGTLALISLTLTGILVCQSQKQRQPRETFEVKSGLPPSPSPVVERGRNGSAQPSAVVVPGLLPEHLRERGPARITLRFQRLSDGGTISAVSGRLWRLRVPASRGWTSGDEIAVLAKESLPEYVWVNMPYGSYRFEYSKKRHGTPDPPEFTIDKPDNNVVIVLDDRRTVPVWLLLYASDGSLYESCTVRAMGGWTHSVPREETPTWASPRVPEGQFVRRVPGQNMTTGDSIGDRTPVARHAEADGRIRVADVTHDRDGSESVRAWSISVSPVMSLRLRVECWNLETTEFVGVAPGESEVLQYILDEESQRIVAAQDVRVEMKSEIEPNRNVARQWASIPVHVRVWRDGYEPLEFNWSVDTRKEPHELRRQRR